MLRPQPTPPATGGAASKVFAVPELLEYILYDIEPCVSWDDTMISQPALYLFRLQRVNRTFKDTIQGSPKLLRLMFLARFPTDTSGVPVESTDTPSPIAPTMWFLDLLGLQPIRHQNKYDFLRRTDRQDLCSLEQHARDYYIDTASIYNGMEDGIGTRRGFEKLNERRKYLMGKREGARASWREMPINCMLEPLRHGPENDVVLVRVIIRVILAVSYSAKTASGEVEWTFGHDDTLGVLFTKYNALMETLTPVYEQIQCIEEQRKNENKGLISLRKEEDSLVMSRASGQLQQILQ